MTDPPEGAEAAGEPAGDVQPSAPVETIVYWRAVSTSGSRWYLYVCPTCHLRVGWRTQTAATRALWRDDLTTVESYPAGDDYTCACAPLKE